MKHLLAVTVFLAFVLVCASRNSDARPKYAQSEEKPCNYCHLRVRGGGPRNYRGIFYKNNNYEFVGFDDEGEAKKAGEGVGPSPSPPPKSLKPAVKFELPLDTPNPAAVPDFGTATFAGIEFVKIPAGTFQQGTTEAHRDELMKIGAWTRMNADEMPARTVRISKPFFLSKYELTQRQWQILMAKPAPENERKLTPAFKGDDLPMDSISYRDALAFCKEVSRGGKGKFRLPTEAEWEYAARAGSTTPFALGNDKMPITPNRLREFAIFSENSKRRPQNVGQKKPNAFGLYDMLGNVWEWCADAYDPTFYSTGPATDPISKPPVVNERVLRGGSWFLDSRAQRPGLRGGALPGVRAQYFGMRLVREL